MYGPCLASSGKALSVPPAHTLHNQPTCSSILCCPAGSTEVYWDLFSLRYKLSQPLSSIFTPEAQAQYNRLSKLLWRLRRAERSLNDAWRTLKVRD
jgi:hypothetical protein